MQIFKVFQYQKVMERLRCVDNKSSKPCKAYLGKSGSLDNFVNNMIEENKY